MSFNGFQLRVSQVDRLADDVIHLTGQLISGNIDSGCRAIIESNGLEVLIKGVVLIHSPGQPANEVTLMVEYLPLPEQGIVGKDIIGQSHE
jgi:hypothetical protein